MAAAQHQLIRCPPPWALILVLGGKIEQRSLDAHDSDQTAGSLQKQLTRTFFLRFGVKNLFAVRVSKMLWEGEIPI